MGQTTVSQTTQSPRADQQGQGDRRPIASVTPVAWRPRQDLEISEWLKQGRWLGSLGRRVGWWIGDWLRYGNDAFGERYVRAAKVTGYDPQTLMNMVYVASKVDISRRRESLSWSHHAEVASIPGDDQERWLAHAESERLSVRDLREEIRRDRRPVDGEDAAELRVAAKDAQHPGGSGLPQDTPLVCPECGHAFEVDEHAAGS